MSFIRLVYYQGLIGGWMAFVGWLLAEMVFGSPESSLVVMLVSAVVGAAIGGGLNIVAGMANGQWQELLRRSLPGLVGGGIGGAVGGLIGNLVFTWIGLPRAFGWMLMGVGIGVVEGLYERSPSKLRNGAIGGAVGGLLGGFLFDPIVSLLASGSAMASRATAFVILGLFIGVLIGLVQMVLKEAWLTVVDGYRAGRQLILSQPVTVLGRAEHLPLPFIGSSNRELEPEHVRIIRQPDGSYVAEDNNTKLGTRVNGQPVRGQMPLTDGCTIKLGTNVVRFNERQRSGREAPAATATAATSIQPPPPPPPIKRPPPVAAASTPAAKPAASAPPPVAKQEGSLPPPPPVTGPTPPPPRPAGTSPPPRPAGTTPPPSPPRPQPQLRPPPPPPPPPPKR